MTDPETGPPGPPAGDKTATWTSDPSDTSLRNLLGLTSPGWRGSDAGGPAGSTLRIGRFEVIDAIGSGGFGEVLRVHDPKLGRIRAMKIPRPEALGSGSVRGRFFREARAAASLDHPNVVRVFEADEAGSLCFLVMEYCEAGSLASWIAGRPGAAPAPFRWAADLVAQLADGVAHAHIRGVLHRDLKPSNVLLVADEEPGDADGPPRFTPKVADFGLAKILDDPTLSDQTASDALIGTIAYMAPEQARRTPAGITEATDVYGLGTILYELLAGRRPFADLHHADLIEHILVREPTPLRSLRPEIPADLDTICRKCLAKAPLDRYARAEDLAADLRRFLLGDPIRARRSPLWKKAHAWSRRHPVQLAMLGLAALGIGGAAVFFEVRARQDAIHWLDRPEAANLSALPELIAERPGDDPRVSARLVDLFAFGPPNKKLAAAVALAATRREYADYAVEQLLSAQPEALGPIARALELRLPDLADRLDGVAAAPADREARDLRRARAAAILILLGRADRAWPSLRFSPDPQARSFLIHLIGPSGVAPDRLADRLDGEADDSARRALIQSLGAVPRESWGPSLRARVVCRVLDLYENDPDPGVHGSARWLLGRWGLSGELASIDGRLSKRPARPGFRWRVGPLGLTLVAVDDPQTGRVIEVGDAEVTVEQFLALRPKHRYVPSVSPAKDSPINSVNFIEAADYCNSLNVLDSIDPSQYCYRRGPAQASGTMPLEAVEGHLDRLGYRLPTEREFELAARAGSTTSRYYGDSRSLLGEYARYNTHQDDQTVTVAALKPNDFGLFGMLGNLCDLCQSTKPGVDRMHVAVAAGTCFTTDEVDVRSSARIAPIFIDQMNVRGISDRIGFRVVRTMPRR